MSRRNRSNVHKQKLAYEAARMMVDQGVREFDRARRKAAARAGVSDRRLWPTNEEIQEALLAQRRLFHGEEQVRQIRDLREQALAAMHALADFAPRLVGSVLSGSADGTHCVRLHLFAESPEDVVFKLLDQGIPWEEGDEVVRYGGGARRTQPLFRFLAGATAFELLVLPVAAQRNPPLDLITDRPERGAGTAEVERLVATGISDASEPGSRQAGGADECSLNAGGEVTQRGGTH